MQLEKKALLRFEAPSNCPAGGEKPTRVQRKLQSDWFKAPQSESAETEGEAEEEEEEEEEDSLKAQPRLDDELV